MKKLFTLALAALLAVPAVMNAQTRQNRVFTNSAVKLNPTTASAARAAAEEESLITNPEGEAKYYTRVTEGYYVSDYERYWGVNEHAAKLVFGENNEVYIDNPVPTLPFGAYLKATIEGNKITAKLPQYVGLYNGSIRYYVSKMKSDPEMTYAPVDDADNVVTWTVNEDGSITLDLDPGEVVIDPETERPVTDPEYTIGLYNVWGSEINFVNSADCKQVFTPVDVESQTAHFPLGMTLEKWSLTTSEGMAPRQVYVGFAGNDIFISNLTDYAPEGVVKGFVDDGKVMIPTGQYLGYLDEYSYFVYFLAAKFDEDDNFQLMNGLIFDYDAEKKQLKSTEDDVILINGNNNRVFWIEYGAQPELNWIDESLINAKPKNPKLTYFEEGYGYYYSAWNIPAVNVNDVVLDTGAMTYNLFMDDEIYTFYNDMYYGIEGEMTYVPYKFTENYDILVDGELHEIYLYDEGFTTLGIQSHFVGTDGKTYSSDIMTYDITTGVTSVEAAKEVKNVEFFNINGAKVSRPDKGLYVMRSTYTDGTTRTVKTFIR